MARTCLKKASGTSSRAASTARILGRLPSHNLSVAPATCRTLYNAAPVRLQKTQPLRASNTGSWNDDDKEKLLEFLEGRADSCKPENEWKLFAMYAKPGSDLTPVDYFKLIITNMEFLASYAPSVEFNEFRSANVEPESTINRGREALMTFATSADRWMQKAISHPEAEEKGMHNDSELLESAQHLAWNTRLIQQYKQGDMPPGTSWQDLCDAILLSMHLAVKNMERYVGGKWE